jgi:formate hydrogenlyase subunit 4
VYALPLLAFAAHLATLVVPAALPYRRIAFIAALVAWALATLVCAIEAINVLDAARQAGLGGRGGPGGSPFGALGASISVSPHFGLLFHLLAPVALWRANSLVAR